MLQKKDLRTYLWRSPAPAAARRPAGSWLVLCHYQKLFEIKISSVHSLNRGSLHNKMAILLAIGVLLPFDLVRAYCKHVYDLSSWTPSALHLHGVEFEVRKLCKDLLVGLFVIDVILGTAHKLSHEGPIKKYLFRYHAQHHTRHHNYSAVKYVGNPFDLEVVLTQVCYAFLPRVLGLDVWTSIFLIDLFSLQLLLEHTGCTKLFALSQHHEMHHNHGNVAFYHFPLTELILGKMPSLKQLSRSSCGTEKK